MYFQILTNELFMIAMVQKDFSKDLANNQEVVVLIFLIAKIHFLSLKNYLEVVASDLEESVNHLLSKKKFRWL